MKNGTKSNRLFRLLNLERESVADLPRWIVAAWSTPSSMKFARAVLGGCGRVILVRGKQSMATFGSGPMAATWEAWFSGLSNFVRLANSGWRLCDAVTKPKVLRFFRNGGS